MRRLFRGRSASGDDAGIDLVPLIDTTLLVLLFFILCGRLTVDERSEQISVPPARAAGTPDPGPQRLVLNLRGGTSPRLGIGHAELPLAAGWEPVRRRLDAAWDAADKRLQGGVLVADAVIEIRADADTPYRLVQELQLVASDAVEPDSLLPRSAARRPFTAIDLSAAPVP
jgi:biopolymer transport protein ExbD